MIAARGLRRLALALTAAGVIATIAVGLQARSDPVPVSALANNPDLDGGTSISGVAPGFTLRDQREEEVSLRRFRGRVVLLAFVDSRCTTVCPLTTSAMVDAKRLLGSAGRQVQLLGIDANPRATSVADVAAYTSAHEMRGQWDFLTGSVAHLRRVWRAYHIAVQIEAGEIDHTPALYAIDAKGRLVKLYVTEMSYASVMQQAQILAQELSNLLPGHPRVRSRLPYRRIPDIRSTKRATLPLLGGGKLAVGPGARARLYVFFATWDAETSKLGAGLEALQRYSSEAAALRLPAVAAIDVGIVEPSRKALPRFLKTLRGPLSYPVAVDSTGRISDGYHVADQPWLVLASAAGRILWWRDVSEAGWPSPTTLEHEVRAALRHPDHRPSQGAVRGPAGLPGYPAALARLHDQAGRLVEGEPGALTRQLHALRGFPVVVNVWASWCPPCEREFHLFASAAARYGRRVAFIGADYEDLPNAARAFLVKHPVSYPSYETSAPQLAGRTRVNDVPTTIFLNAAGEVAHIHIGQYGSAAILDADIDRFAD